jgi:hypothetical protein
MAFSAVTSRGSAVSNASGTTITRSPTADITAGKICIVQVVSDNLATANGTSNNLTLSDTDSHTWTKVYENTDSDGAAADGSTTSLWWTKVTSTISTADVITCTFSSAVVDKIISVFEVTIGSGNTVATILSTIVRSDSATELSASLSSLTNREYLYVGSFGAEGEDTAKTAIAGYTELFDLVSSTTGVPAVNVQSHIGTKIETSTGTTWTSSAVTFTNGTQAVVAFYEVQGVINNIVLNIITNM